MKSILRLVCTLCIFAFYFNRAQPAAADESGIQLTIDLRDGSRVVGKSLNDSLSFHSTALGDAKLPWAGIRSIEYGDSTNTARLTVTNSDVFTVQLTADTLSLETGFGKSELPVKLIKTLKVSAIVPTAATGQAGSQLTIELRDGSHVVGKGLDDTLNFHSPALGDLKLSWAGIRSIEYADTNTDTAKLTATSGDAYAVQFSAPIVRVETSFGKSELPVNLIRNIKVSAAATFGLPSGLVSLWSGEGDANDSVGGNNAKLAGNVTYGNGRIGQGFVFNGYKDWVDVGNPANLQLQDFTITVWIERDNTSSVSGIFNRVAMLFCFANGGYGFYLNPDGQPGLSKMGVPGTSPDKTITDTNWHHLAVTKSGSTVVFYIDGIGYPAPAYDREFTFSNNGSIGGQSTRRLEYTFAGAIDEVAIYNRALSASEIQAVYTEQNQAPLPPPLKITRKAPTTTTINGTFHYEINSSTR